MMLVIDLLMNLEIGIPFLQIHKDLRVVVHEILSGTCLYHEVGHPAVLDEAAVLESQPDIQSSSTHIITIVQNGNLRHFPDRRNEGFGRGLFQDFLWM
jgi:hypothetical protein